MKLTMVDMKSVINVDNSLGSGVGESILPTGLPPSYTSLIKASNGGITEDKYFHFFGLNGPVSHNVVEWNKQGLWKQYFELSDSCFVFSEDIFGNQYFFKRGSRKNPVYVLWLSTGRTDFMAETFDYFVRDIVDDPSEEVMGELKGLARAFIARSANQWKPFNQIGRKVPILLGGKNDLSNMEFCDSLTNVLFAGQLLSQLKAVPLGTRIKDVILDKEKLQVKIVF
jgi:hypothetical protein